MAKSVEMIVVGGGIVGLAVAEKLLSEGKSVTLVEREEIAAGASRGNAAGLAFSDIMPLASPGIVRKAIKWFLDPVGPFAVVPQDLPHTLGWLLRFLKAASPAQFKRSIDVQAALMHLGKDTFETMVQRCSLQDMVRTNGALHLYESKAAYQRDLKNWHFRREHNIAFECYEDEALHNFQPGLSPTFKAGIFASTWQSVSDPHDFCNALHHHLTEQGMQTVYGEVRSVTDGMVTLASGDRLEAEKIVIAAGPWSAQLSGQLGDPVPLIGERGYNTTLPKNTWGELDHTLVLSEHGFVVVPLSDGIRVGGASEIAKLGRDPNYKRSRTMLAKAKRLLPGMKASEDGQEWMGARPAIPDTLPVIGYSSKSENIIYAFGHGHLGLTQSSATAQLVWELANKQKTSIDITALRATRF